MCCFKSTIFAWLLFLVASSAGQGLLHGQSVAEKREVAIDGSTVLVDGRPFFPRMIQHNGESFEFLKSLGFNTVQLTGPASDNQLKEAAAAKVRVVCPPPAFLGVRSVSRSYQPVLAWSVGNKVVANQVQLTRERITDIKDADSFERPVFIHAKSHWATYAQLTGILGVGEPVIGTNRRLKEYGRWISNVSRNQIQPIWADVQTELPRSLIRQVDAFTGSSVVAPLQHQQMCFQMYEAITAGCRGIRFLSRNRLDANDPETQLRVTSLRWLLGHAQQLEPWIAGGLVRKKGSLSTPDRQVFSITLPGSQVLLIQRSTGFEQWACGDVPLETIEFASVSSSLSDRVYRVNELGAIGLASPDSVRGTRIKVRNAAASTAVLITADPMVVSRLNAQISGVPIELQQRLELVRQALAYIQFVEQRLAATGVGFPFVGGAREQASKDFANAEQILARGDFDVARQYLVKADVNIAMISRQLIEQQLNTGIGYFSTPLLMHAGLVPAHLSSATRFLATQWNPNSLTGGDFENLDQMTRAGWKNRRDNENGLTTRVELEQAATVQGTYGLKLTVEGVSPSIGVQSAPLWIESAPVAVKQGQLVRIHGFVNVSEMGFGGRAFEITDSISGNELAVPFESTNGWREFTIYRAVDRDTNMTVSFSVNGIGTAMVDEVTVRSMDPTTLKEQAKTQASEIK